MHPMVMSMTGYGEGRGDLFKVEIRSYNHRFLELILRLPPQFNFLETRVRDHLKKRISRGKIQTNITYLPNEGDGFEIDYGVAKGFISTLRDVGRELGLRDDLSLSHLISSPLIRLKEKGYELESIWPHLEGPLDEAVDNLLEMRETEGKKLGDDLLRCIERIKEALDEIDKMKDGVVAHYRDRLSKRISEIVGEGVVDHGRLEEEVALFAERSDINEEIVRLRSHLEGFLETLTLRTPIGKRLDFLSQELNREINTISSKTPDLGIIKGCLLIKNELERIREQIQNIE